MEETFLDRKKIRTMSKDLKEASGILVYPREDDEEEFDLPQVDNGFSNIEISKNDFVGLENNQNTEE